MAGDRAAIAKFFYVFSKDCSARSRQRWLRDCRGLDTARLRSTALLAHGIDIDSNRQARRYRAGREWRDEVRHALLHKSASAAGVERGRSHHRRRAVGRARIPGKEFG